MARKKIFLWKVWDIVFLVRPPLLCASFAFFFAGVAASGDGWVINKFSEPFHVFSNLLLFALVTSIAFVINQILDTESDRINNKVFIIPLNLVSRLEASIFATLLVIATIVLSHKVSPFEIILVWSGVTLGILYSLPPARLKSVPIADVASNSIGFGLIGFMLGWLSIAPLEKRAFVLCSGYATAMAGIFLNTLIADEDGDRIVGDRTTCVVFGKRRVAVSAFVSILGAAAIAFLNGDGLLWIGMVGSIPAFLGALLEPSKETSVIASQTTAWIFVFLVGLKIPVYLLIAFAILIVSRIYYRSRLDLIYPSLV